MKVAVVPVDALTVIEADPDQAIETAELAAASTLKDQCVVIVLAVLSVEAVIITPADNGRVQ